MNIIEAFAIIERNSDSPIPITILRNVRSVETVDHMGLNVTIRYKDGSHFCFKLHNSNSYEVGYTSFDSIIHARINLVQEFGKEATKVSQAIVECLKV